MNYAEKILRILYAIDKLAYIEEGWLMISEIGALGNLSLDAVSNTISRLHKKKFVYKKIFCNQVFYRITPAGEEYLFREKKVIEVNEDES